MYSTSESVVNRRGRGGTSSPNHVEAVPIDDYQSHPPPNNQSFDQSNVYMQQQQPSYDAPAYQQPNNQPVNQPVNSYNPAYGYSQSAMPSYDQPITPSNSQSNNQSYDRYSASSFPQHNASSYPQSYDQSVNQPTYPSDNQSMYQSNYPPNNQSNGYARHPSTRFVSSSVKQSNNQSIKQFRTFMYVLMCLCAFWTLIAMIAMGFQSIYLVVVLLICCISFYLILQLAEWIFAKDSINQSMMVISQAIKSGSEGFLEVQYTAIAWIALIVAVVLFVVYLFRPAIGIDQSSFLLALMTSISYLVGAFCSGLAGYIGVWVSVRVNIRVSIAASKLSYSDALLLSFRGGAVSAALSATLCILGLAGLYVACYVMFCSFGSMKPSDVPMLMSGYSFGGALVALFMQLGGGIYTKAADVGADMCGKIEVGIPEDDPRNPAVIADLVGDNVGDCAGSMADVFESIAAEMIGTMILGAQLAKQANIESGESFVFFPLIIHSLDLLVSALGIYLVQPRNDKEDPIEPMKRSYGICMATAAVGMFIACRLCLYTTVAPSAWWHYALCGLIGIAMSFCLLRVTQHYTDSRFGPVQRIVAASATGHGTNVIAGLAVGLESTCAPILVICVSLWCAFHLGASSGLPPHVAGVYGTAVATCGMLCTAVFVLSMNNFGPIADNAGGICEMSGQSEEVRRLTDRLDSVGNVTKAASKGYAVGGSALSCFVLFQAFLDEISEVLGSEFHVVNFAKVESVLGALIGVMLIFVFAGWSMAAVGTTAQKVVWEVRRQLKDNPRIMEGSELPDYQTCVKIVTKAALREMVAPALLALGTPVVIGFLCRAVGDATGQPLLGVEVIACFMLCGTFTGLCMALFMDNAGGAWDNAKKFIESDGQKGSASHQAAVTGDTVGDPFKDTAGPSIHVIITTMSTTILVLGPMLVGSTYQRQ